MVVVANGAEALFLNPHLNAFAEPGGGQVIFRTDISLFILRDVHKRMYLVLNRTGLTGGKLCTHRHLLPELTG